MKEQHISKIEKKIAYLIGMLLFSYLVLRSIYSPILHDEIATFYYYIQPGIYFPPHAHWDANNHILNSMLSGWSYQLFGDAPWALRLPNVLAYILFVWATWKLASLLQNKSLRWGFFLAMTMAHYMFEYFNETRGYGLSMAFLSLGIFFTIRYLNSAQYRYLLGLLMAYLLACMANLTLLYSCLLIGVVLVFSVWQRKEIIQIKLAHYVTLFVGMVMLYPLIQFGFDLKERGALYYGGKEGFWKYTGNTLSELFLGYYSTEIAVLLTLLFSGILISFLWHWYRQKSSLQTILKQHHFIWVYLFVGSIAAIFATRYILDVNFPEDRTAMYLYPYLIGSLAFTIDRYSSQFLQYTTALMFLYFPVQFIFKANITHATWSMEERAPQEYFDQIKTYTRINPYPFTIGGARTQELCWNYMNHQSGGYEGKFTYTNHVDTLCDFQIVNIHRKTPSSFKQLYTQLNNNPINELNLYERKNKLKRIHVLTIDSITNWVHQQNEYFELISYKIPDSLIGKTLYAGVQATLHSPEKPFASSLVFSLKTAEFVEVHQEAMPLHWMKKNWDNTPNNLTHGIMMPTVPSNASYIIVYLWNHRKVDYLIHNGKLELFVLE